MNKPSKIISCAMLIIPIIAFAQPNNTINQLPYNYILDNVNVYESFNKGIAQAQEVQRMGLELERIKLENDKLRLELEQAKHYKEKD